MALAMAEFPQARDVREPEIEDPLTFAAESTPTTTPAPPFARSFGVATAGDLAEPEPESEFEPESESAAEITAQDLPPIPAADPESVPGPVHVLVPPAFTPRPDPVVHAPSSDLDGPSELDRPPAFDRPSELDRPSGFVDERNAASSELAATRAELESLRADFQAERFRSRDERLRLEDELASARRAAVAPVVGEPADADEIGALQREVDLLRGELAALRSRHAEEIDRLEADVKAAQAREAQTVIAAQLAEDELKAVRSEAASATARASDAAAVRGQAEALQRRVEELEQQVRVTSETGDQRARSLEAKLVETEKDLRISRETAGERIRQIELQLATREAELATTPQELLESEGGRADEAASFLATLQKQV